MDMNIREISIMRLMDISSNSFSSVRVFNCVFFMYHKTKKNHLTKLIYFAN